MRERLKWSLPDLKWWCGYNCLPDATGPGCALEEIRTRTLPLPEEAGHLGEGASVQTGGTDQRGGQDSQGSEAPGILRVCGQPGRARG